LSLDLLLALIPITIMLGLVAADMGNIMYDTQDTIYRSSLERVSADTVNTLLKTSGDPYNWESNPSQVNVVGVAQYDPSNKNPIEYTLSTKKMAMLKSTIGQNKTQTMLGDQYGFLITLSPVNSTQNIVWNLTSTGTPKESAKDIVKIERDVLYNPFNSEVLTSIKNAGRSTSYKDYTSTSFSTSQSDLEVYDYYLLIFDNGATFRSGTSYGAFINTNRILSRDNLTGNLYKNWTVVIPESYLKNGTSPADNFLYLKSVSSTSTTWMDAYVIRVPQGTSPSEVTVANALPKSYRFQFYAWTK
jgi:hypothetical protein